MADRQRALNIFYWPARISGAGKKHRVSIRQIINAKNPHKAGFN
ncbi:hypothetical protein L584_16985 [Pantoea agglomerans Tx10]|nr:hypothetical protein L584_16985 [Pantoea agglomerans Tx10]